MFTNHFLYGKRPSDLSGDPKILVIDDSTIDLRFLMAMMSARNMRLTVAFNGQEGYEKASLQQPDLILLDVVMPKLDGFATCRMLKSNVKTRHIPIIFLSAHSEVDKRLEGLSLGAVDYIGKPFSEEEVVAKVEIHLNLLRQLRARQLPADSDAEVSGVAEPGEHSHVNSKNSVLIRSATQYLRQRLRRPPSTEILARTLGTNEKRLNLAFQERFAMPMFSWIREERLRQAHALVTTTETSLLSISDHLGYSSPANFSKAFRDRFGCCPRELRKKLYDGSLSDNAKARPFIEMGVDEEF